MLKKAYLLAYNGAMLGGWGLILAKIIKHLTSGGSIEEVYPLIAKLLVVFQSGALMEVIHAATGLVRSPVGTTFLQVLSRLIVLYGSLRIGDTDSRRTPFLPQMLIAWSLSEIIRYSYYAANLIEVKAKPHSWLRYSAFTVLYPIGITGEIACLYKALPYIKENKPWTMELPNRYNFTFSWYNTVWFVLLGVYPYGSYLMYSYMLGQRRKVLATEDSASYTKDAKPREAKSSPRKVK